ncbi:MAG: hypothetical protein JWM59_3690 [Verrucomicrobiales bacterium]|nr:hypothetical protein [Verrucomicrobiales bacterium]
MLVQCPHCFNRVLLRNDETCPSCQQPVDVNGPEIVHKIVQIREGMKLPRVCFHCAAEATGHAMAKLVAEREEADFALRFILARLLPSVFRGTSGAKVIRVDMPACRACEDKPQSAFLRGWDPRSGFLRVVVHRDFAAAMK